MIKSILILCFSLCAFAQPLKAQDLIELPAEKVLADGTIAGEKEALAFFQQPFAQSARDGSRAGRAARSTEQHQLAAGQPLLSISRHHRCHNLHRTLVRSPAGHRHVASELRFFGCIARQHELSGQGPISTAVVSIHFRLVGGRVRQKP